MSNPAWDAHTKYIGGDVVSHAGSDYVAQSSSIGKIPPAWPWEAIQSGTSVPVYWSGAATAAGKVTLAEILAADMIVWTESHNVGEFVLSMDGKTLTLPAGGLFVVLLHISGYDNSDGVMDASLGGSGLGGGSTAAITPLAGDDYGEGEVTHLAAGASTVTVQAGFGSITPTKGSFEAYLAVYKIA